MKPILLDEVLGKIRQLLAYRDLFQDRTMVVVLQLLNRGESHHSPSGDAVPFDDGRGVGDVLTVGGGEVYGWRVGAPPPDFGWSWNPRTTCRLAKKGRPSAVVSTAMRKGVWPRRPRPEPSPVRSPPI